MPDALSGAELARVPAKDVDHEGVLRFGIVPERSRWNKLITIDEVTGVLSMSNTRSREVRNKIVTDITVYVTGEYLYIGILQAEFH